ncbi:MAG: hypothetical protein ACFFDH_13620 [Promethearchaeota archaeon]
MKKKIYLVLFIFFITVSLIRIQNVHSHRPSCMDLFYSNSELSVTIHHEVSDPNSHYISLVEIQLNGTLVLTESYTSQPNSIAFTCHYNITANTNDKLEVIATCNQGGSFKGCIIVGVGSCPADGFSRIGGYFRILIILGISVLGSLLVTFRKMEKRIT